MEFHSKTAEVFVPDDLSQMEALKRTTHMAISAHQDDIEIMAAAPIIECFQQEDKWFTGVVLTDGRGSPRDGLYSEYTNEEMHDVRKKEQKKAAIIGEYSAQVLLDYPSKQVKDGSDNQCVEDIARILQVCQPEFLFTHNLADKHDTHVATVLRVIEAIRSLPEKMRPEKFYGCEVWRNLDWMIDEDKVLFDLTSHENLQAALLGVFDSQICGGKRYDLAAMGRRKANATFFESHELDSTQGLSFGMNLTPLIKDDRLEIKDFVKEFISHFAMDVNERLAQMGRL